MQEAQATQDAETMIVTAVTTLLQRREDGEVIVTLGSHLNDDLDFDSLELAELSIMLEDSLGRDPYSEGATPRTVGDVVAFYSG